MCCLCVYVFARVYISAFKNVALGLKRYWLRDVYASGFISMRGRCVAVYGWVCEIVYLREFWQLSESMLLSNSTSWTLRTSPHPHPSCLPQACSLLAWCLWDYSQPQGVSAFIQPLTAPPLIQLFVSFFKIAPGNLCADAAFPVWEPGSGKTSGEQLSTAA